jgi:hypothetical protein
VKAYVRREIKEAAARSVGDSELAAQYRECAMMELQRAIEAITRRDD